MIDIQTTIKKCKENDRIAQKIFYEHYFNFLMSICYRYQKNYDDAVFLLNTGFVKIMSSLSKYDSKKPIEPWLKVIMVNVAIDEFRKNKKYDENNVLLNDLDWSKLSDESVYMDDNAVLDTEDYLKLVTNIPDPAGTVFNLYVIDEFGHKEIADRLNISERSSKRYLKQAREWLLNKIKMNHVSRKQYG